MINPLQSATGSGAPDPRPSDPAPAKRPGAPHPETPVDADVRLSIEASPEGRYFVYTLQDRATGRVIAQLPRQVVEALGDSLDYKAGDLIRTRA